MLMLLYPFLLTQIPEGGSACCVHEGCCVTNSQALAGRCTLYHVSFKQQVETEMRQYIKYLASHLPYMNPNLLLSHTIFYDPDYYSCSKEIHMICTSFPNNPETGYFTHKPQVVWNHLQLPNRNPVSHSFPSLHRG